MTDAAPILTAEQQPALRTPGPPVVVIAAAVVTWLMATVVASMTFVVLFLVVILAVPFHASFAPGAGNPVWLVLESLVVAMAASFVAVALGVYVVRGHRWAQVALIVLSVIAAFVGIVTAAHVLALLFTVGGVAVIVLLLTPGARRFFRADQGLPLSPHP